MFSRFYNIIPAGKRVADSEIHLLNDEELRFISKVELRAIVFSAALGGIMVIALYFPQYYFSAFFFNENYTIPFLNISIEFNLNSAIYGILLCVIEVMILTFLHIYCVHEIGLYTGYINKENKKDDSKKNVLLKIGYQNKSEEILSLGINPYYGLPKYLVLLYNLMFTLKATLSNVLFRIFIQKLLGRYAVKFVLDMLGIPIFAFWNAIGTKIILKESRIIIMGENYLHFFSSWLLQFRKLNDDEKRILYDSLQMIALCKRDFHKNHYILSKYVLDSLDIKYRKKHLISKDYYEEVARMQNDFIELNEIIIILGLVLDGKISLREKNRIKKLRKKKIIKLGLGEIEKISTDFAKGKGIDLKFSI